jgi:hypothetical protein
MNRLIKIGLALLLIACMALTIGLPVEAQGGSVVMSTGFNVSGSNGGQQIPIGSTIQHFNDGTTKVFNSSNSLILTTSDADSKLVATSDGYQKADRIYGVPSGTLVNHSGNILKCYNNNQLILTVIDATSNNNNATNNSSMQLVPNFPIINATQTTAPDYFDAHWICPDSPPNPDNNDVTNFVWDGIQTSGMYLIQPVLQWNQTMLAQGGGNGAGRWTGAATYVYPGGYVYTVIYMPVNQGDSCEGTLQYNSNGYWTVMFYNHTQSYGIGLMVQATYIPVNPPGGNLAILELETDDAAATYWPAPPHLTNGMIPGTTVFTNISLTKNGQNVNGTWYTMVWAPFTNDLMNLTNLNITTSGNTSVTMYTPN